MPIREAQNIYFIANKTKTFPDPSVCLLLKKSQAAFSLWKFTVHLVHTQPLLIAVV